MSETRKVRPDAKLKLLPEERQAQIDELCREKSLKEACAALRADGLSVSQSALSEFLSWWSLKQQFRADESTTESLIEELRKAGTALSDEELDQLGQRTFSLLAIRREDPETFLRFRTAMSKGRLEREKLEIRKRQLEQQKQAYELDVMKFQFDAAKQCLAVLPELKLIQTNRSLNEAQKIEAIRRRIFGQLPATPPTK